MDFDRWTPVRDHSWPYYIFKQYNEELCEATKKFS